MCGICGIALSERSRRHLDVDTLTAMRATLSHRGPDDCGTMLSGNIGLAHQRLSIVDLTGGHQPMQSEDGAFSIVYNGEVYNHPELSGWLQGRGHRYRTRCDTETVLHLYREEGAAGVERLRGMFAFAIWDAPKGELFLARDRLGIKPLYYVHADDGSLFFASEIKALLEVDAVAPALNYAALPDYLANHAPSGEETLFMGVRRLPPGHTLTWHDGEVTIARYWDVSFENTLPERSDARWVEDFRELFTEAVRIRLMADVPLGMFLSGGIDSAAITAVMSTLVSDPIKTFSVAFEEREANEFAYARLVSSAFHTDHHEIVVSADDFFARLPHLIWQEDEPIAHPSSVPLHFVSELAARHVKVVLTGEGSDELLGGYGRYRKTLQNLALGRGYERLVPAAARGAVRQWIEAMGPRVPLQQKLLRTFLYHPATLENIYFDNFAVFSRARQRRLLTPAARELAGGADPYAIPRQYLDATDARTLLDRLLYADIKTYLHELLMKQDQMSMSASLESRVPFLDHHLVEFAAQLPERMKLRGASTKHILRESMRDILPAAILKRKKMGFPVPFGAWIRGRFRPLIEDVVLGDRALDRGIFHADELFRLMKEHDSARVDHSERLWSLLNLELWQRRFLDGEASAAPSALPEALQIAECR